MGTRVVQGGSIEEDAEGPTAAGRGKDVEEEAIDDHADVLPVPLFLQNNEELFLKTDPDSGHKWLRSGAWLYGVHRTCAETAGVSRGTSHVANIHHCKYITSVDIQKHAVLYKKKRRLQSLI